MIDGVAWIGNVVAFMNYGLHSDGLAFWDSWDSLTAHGPFFRIRLLINIFSGSLNLYASFANMGEKKVAAIKTLGVFGLFREVIS